MSFSYFICFTTHFLLHDSKQTSAGHQTQGQVSAALRNVSAEKELISSAVSQPHGLLCGD